MDCQLVIAHRVCPVLSAKAVGFRTKLDLVRAGAESMRKALGGLAAKLVVVLDGCPTEYEQLFSLCFPAGCGVDLRFVRTPSIGNCATYAKQIEILRDEPDEMPVYLSEDDYLYDPAAFRKMLSCIKCSWCDFLTPLDHPDRYNDIDGQFGSREVRVCENWHWMEVTSTCCTFMTTAGCLRRAEGQLMRYARGSSDFATWLIVTRKALWRLPFLFAVALRMLLHLPVREALRQQARIWMRHPLAVLSAPRFRLWGPVPTLAVHVCDNSLPPGAAAYFATASAEEVERLVQKHLRPYPAFG